MVNMYESLSPYGIMRYKARRPMQSKLKHAGRAPKSMKLH